MAANGVKLRHKDYDRYAKKWQRVRDVMAGQDEIHAGGVRYLSALTDEPIGDYLARVNRTPFYNASWRTIAAFVGMMFSKPPTLEVPAKLKALLEDVTMSGVSFDNFAQDIVLEDISISRLGVLVDHPQRARNEDGTLPFVSAADAEVNGFRPLMVMYKAEAIINWDYDFINNHHVLRQVRLHEMHKRRKSEFEVEEYGVIRVLDLAWGKYRQRLFMEDTEEQIGGDIFPLMDGKALDFIPFYFIGDLSAPVLIDLVDLNLKHYQVSADYEHACHMTALPTPVVSGLQPKFDQNGQQIEEKLYIGSTSAWLLPQGAEAKFLEFTGTGVTAIENNLTRKEAQMAAIGARMLTAEKSGVEAAETVAMRHAGENSILSAIAVAVSEGLTGALITFARWAGIKDASDKTIKYEINRDFMPFPITPQAMTSLLAAVQAGTLSHESFFNLLKRGDLIESDIDFEAEQARIDSNPVVPAPVAGAEDEDEDEDEQKVPAKAAA